MKDTKRLKKHLAVLDVLVFFGLSGCGQKQVAEADKSVQETTEQTSENENETHLDYENQERCNPQSISKQAMLK